MWSWPSVVVAMVRGLWRAAKDVHHRLRGPHALARRRLASGPSLIADRALVTVTGTVRATATLTAPLSGRSCVAYHSVATLYGGDHDREILATLEERRSTRFELELERDGTLVMIDGEHADLAEEPRPTIPRQLEREHEFVARQGHPMALARRGGFAEVIISAGERIRVHGLAVIEPHPLVERGYRDGATQVRIIAHPAHALTIGRA